MSGYQVITDIIIKKLEEGVIPWSKPWRERPDRNLVSGNEYSGINRLLLNLEEYSSPYWLTFKQAQRLGGHVQKGSKGTRVIYWNIKTYTKEEEGEEVNKSYLIDKTYTLFNLEQCEGIDPPKDDIEVIDFNEITEAQVIVDNMPNPPGIDHKGKGRAFYRPSKDSVSMPQKETFKSEEEYYSTLFHELAHATGHKSRLDRGIEKPTFFGSYDYSLEELVAEMTSAMLCGHVNIAPKTLDNSAAYIASWLRKFENDNRVLISAASQAQKASDYILGKINKED